MSKVSPGGQLELDRVAPPAGYDDPTLVVWRRFGRMEDRVIQWAAVMALYLVVIGVFYGIGFRQLDAWTIAVDGVALLIGIGQAWLMANPRPYYAAGSTWLTSWSNNGLWSGRGETERRQKYVCRFSDVARVELTIGRKGATMVRFVRTDGSKLAFPLQALQSCPSLVAVIERGLAGRDVEIPPDVSSAWHREPQGRDWRGSTVVRPGVEL